MTDQTERGLLATDDAMIWAEEFCRIFDGFTITRQPEDVHGLINEGSMVAWFANAMQTAVNHYERKKLHEKGELTETEKFLQQWNEDHPQEAEMVEEDEPVTLEESFLEGFEEGRPA